LHPVDAKAIRGATLTASTKDVATIKITTRNIVYFEGIVCFSEYTHHPS